MQASPCRLAPGPWNRLHWSKLGTTTAYKTARDHQHAASPAEHKAIPLGIHMTKLSLFKLACADLLNEFAWKHSHHMLSMANYHSVTHPH